MKHLMFVLVTVLSVGLFATDSTWKGGTSGSWFDEANWEGGVPGNVRNAAGTITGNGNRAVFPTGTDTITIADAMEILTGGLSVKSDVKSTGGIHLTGLLSGAGGLVTSGVGRLFIEHTANTYTGTTSIGQTGHFYFNTIADPGTPSSLGAPTGDNAVLEVTAAAQVTLNQTGTQSTTRGIRMQSKFYLCAISGATLDFRGFYDNDAGKYDITSRNSGTINLYGSVTGSVSRTDGGTLNLRGSANRLGDFYVAQGSVYAWSFGSGFITGRNPYLSLGQNSSPSAGVVGYAGTGDVTTAHDVTYVNFGRLVCTTAGASWHLTGAYSGGITTATGGNRKHTQGFIGPGHIILDAGINEMMAIDTGSSTFVTIKGCCTMTNGTPYVFQKGKFYLEGGWSVPDGMIVTARVYNANSGFLSCKGRFKNVAIQSGNGGAASAEAWGYGIGAGSHDATGSADIDRLLIPYGYTASFKIDHNGTCDHIYARSFHHNNRAYFNFKALNGYIRAGKYHILSWDDVDGGAAANVAGGCFFSSNADNQVPPGSYFSSEGKKLYLNVPNTASQLTWNESAGDTWDHATALFTDVATGAAAAFEDGYRVNFQPTAVNKTVTAVEAVAPSDVIIDTDKDFTLAATAPISATGFLSKTGKGSFTITGPQSYARGFFVTNGTAFTQTADSVLGGEGIDLLFGAYTNVLSGTNTFTGRIRHLPAGTSVSSWLIADNDASFGSVTQVWTYGNRNSNCGILLKNGARISDKTLVIGGRSGNRPGIGTFDATPCAWVGDIVEEPNATSHDNLYLCSKWDNVNGDLTVGKEDGSSIVSGKFSSINLRGYGGILRIRSKFLTPDIDLVRNDAGTAQFCTTGNQVRYFKMCEGQATFTVAEAFSQCSGVEFGKNQKNSSAWIKLGGFDQTFGGIKDVDMSLDTNIGNKRYLQTDADKPATLTLDVASGKSFKYGKGNALTESYITGPLSIVKKGAGSQVFGNTAAMTGSVTVEAGTLVFTNDCSFASASGFTVKGGRMVFSSNVRVMGPDKTLSYFTSADSVIELNRDETVTFFEVDGRRMPGGTYGGLDSTATYRSAKFAGTGRLLVKSPEGLNIIVK